MIRYASVCSGVEAASLAWEPLGWRPVWFSEIEPFPCAVLKERYPDAPNLGDMTKIKGENYRGMVDLLVGGTPCQGFSVAGKRGGLDDERSVLCLSFLNLVRTMRPRWFVWENVPGVFSTNGGEDFKAFLRAIDEIGYSCAFRVLDAQYCRVDGYPRAVPQRRRRVFIVGHIGTDWRYPAEVLLEPESLFGNHPPKRIKGKGFTADAQRSVGAASTIRMRSGCEGEGGKGALVSHERSLTLAAAGNDQAVFVSRAISIGNGQIAPTVTGDHLNRITDYTPIVQQERIGYYPIQYAGFQEAESVIVTAHICKGVSNEIPLVQEGSAFAIAENIIGRKVENGGNGIGVQEERAYTQNATGVMGVASQSAVRRLTPIECERLMGFPDNWTRIPWKGKPEEDCPDSPRYKACGNSMCVNVMRWIGMRIEEVEKRRGK